MKSSKNRIKWTEKEDEILFELVQENGKTDWIFISQELYKITKVERSSQQCLQRYNSQINPKVNKDKWEKAQLIRLFQLFQTFGTRWIKIQRKLETNRSPRDIKNRIHLAIRKGLRRICKSFGIKNSTEKLKKIKPKQLVENLNTLQQKLSREENHGESIWKIILYRSEDINDEQLLMIPYMAESKLKSFVNQIVASLDNQMIQQKNNINNQKDDLSRKENQKKVQKNTLAQINFYEEDSVEKKVKQDLNLLEMPIEDIELASIQLNYNECQGQNFLLNPYDSNHYLSPFRYSNLEESGEDQQKLMKTEHKIESQFKQKQLKKKLKNRNKKK